ncbi:hypothetical protein [Mycolicibacterium arenosum]|uniref:Uncharacterized protein n=1 Tax=Mycolicibacterium arenosum TaxID=2952157 RepID=A0ABT1MA74_9MYCO|nr:hypothetical protein [Mycolicibacterium sp. CAU 1645]MCP9276055.1 hypothetical protein [Mycolicibacterium sp. CAU 1645]
MTEMSIAPDALRADAAWVRGFAEHVVEIDWPAVELAGSEVAVAIAEARPGLAELASGLRAWADAATVSATELESADRRGRAGLPPR